MKVEFQSFQSAPGGEAGGNERSRIHSSPAARQGQADRRGPRGGLEIKGSGQAGGAISRIGWGCMREIPPVEALHQTIRPCQSGRTLPNEIRRLCKCKRRAISDYLFPLAESQSFCVSWFKAGRVKVGTGTPFLGASTLEKLTGLATILAMSAPFGCPRRFGPRG